MKKFLLSFLFATSVFAATAEVVRPAPDFSWQSFNGSSKTLAGLRGQPVVLLIAPSAKSSAFKKQIKQLAKLYRQYAGREAVFVAAFTQEAGPVESDIPFLYASDPQNLAASYGFADEKFELVVISPDRNMDLVTNNVVSGERVKDVIDNSFARQSIRRK